MKSMFPVQKWTEVMDAQGQNSSGPGRSQPASVSPSSGSLDSSNGSSAYQLCELGNLSIWVSGWKRISKAKMQWKYFWDENDKKKLSGTLPVDWCGECQWWMLWPRWDPNTSLTLAALAAPSWFAHTAIHCQILKLAWKVQKRSCRWSWGCF